MVFCHWFLAHVDGFWPSRDGRPNTLRASKGPSKNYVTAWRGEGVNDFVTYGYVYFELEGGILWNNYVTVDTILELKEHFLGFLVHYKTMRMKFIVQIYPVHIAKDELLV